ncbi:hypothetical protein A2872_02650 [Candidatus Gottesmanbacteria bacterium RIFCSPHIGHO2_01_FULL_42_12]|uniref:Uncharacterized protein n=1 Tax=Candidatus Gottesmanbacteria bacterium RIFCSPHIGHO2_01_FULL_42_12 TaxID=1798377 RepID=A0A1F5Z0F5_9BACT|nr:MAG: hypothetical protein A2872_02650 [Candidatus Gottesmanbacteria bacterium RIFCSPHIGHO2_01_FULL_42_12]
MSLDQLIGFTNLFTFWAFVKLFFLVLLFFYFVLSLVIARQVDLMNQVLGTNISPFIRLVVIVHSVAVAILFLLAFALV